MQFPKPQSGKVGDDRHLLYLNATQPSQEDEEYYSQSSNAKTNSKIEIENSGSDNYGEEHFEGRFALP